LPERVLDRAERAELLQCGGVRSECGAEALAFAKRRGEDLLELEEGERVGERALRERGGPLSPCIGCAHLRWDGRQVPRPGGEREGGARDGAAASDLRLDGGNEEARELRGAVDAETSDLVADAAVGEASQHRL